MESLLRDFRYAVRQLVRSPVFSATAVLIVAVGIGANTAAFSVVDATLLRPQPFERPEELVDLYLHAASGRPGGLPFPVYRNVAAHGELFRAVAATFPTVARLQREDVLLQVSVELATSNYLEVLGLQPSVGRWFDPPEDRAGAEPVAVLSYRTWQERFGADPGVLGTVLRMNGTPVTVIGIGPRDYNGYVPFIRSDAWLSLSSLGPLLGNYAMESLQAPGVPWYAVKARLLPGVTPARAQAAMDGLAVRLARELPDAGTGHGFTVFAPGEVRMHPDIDALLLPSAAVLMTIVGLVLLIACSNLANLVLVRAAGRTRETSIRLALGASRALVARQLLTESVLLSLAGGLVGLVLAGWAVRGLAAIQLPTLPLSGEFQLDHRVLGFAILLSWLTGALFGMAPAWRASRFDLRSAMCHEATAVDPRTGRVGRLQNGLVVVQVAISFVLLAGAGLFIRSLAIQQDIDTGFVAEGVAYLEIDPSLGGHSYEQGSRLMSELVERVRALPEVEVAALSSQLPVSPHGTRALVIEGHQPPVGSDGVSVPFTTVDDRYFETVRVPVLRGRPFSAADRADGERVAVVSEAFARAYFGGGDAVGRHFSIAGAPDSRRRIVGVVGDVLVRDLTETTGPHVYFPWAQSGPSLGVVLARTSADAAPLIGRLRDTLRAVDADLPTPGAGTMAGHLKDVLAPPRLGARLLAGCAAVGLMLASLGLYGVVGHTVHRRMAEVGIRMTLGARPEQIVWLVLRGVMLLVGVGIALGAAVSLAANSVLAGVLFGVSPADPLTLSAVALLLLAVAATAALIPAVRAIRSDPVLGLRSS